MHRFIFVVNRPTVSRNIFSWFKIKGFPCSLQFPSPGIMSSSQQFISSQGCPSSQEQRKHPGSTVLILPFVSKSMPSSLQASNLVWTCLPAAPCVICRKCPWGNWVPLRRASRWRSAWYAGELSGLPSSLGCCLRSLTLNGLKPSPGGWLQPGSTCFSSASRKWEIFHLM